MSFLTVDDVLTQDQLAFVERYIEQAELRTSAEIRLHFEDHCYENVLDHAAFIFAELQMHHTALRNGVLIYIAPGERKLAVIGDQGINAKVGQPFWDQVRATMVSFFSKGDYEKGIIAGLDMVATELEKHFPRMHSDLNELPNTISIGRKNTGNIE